MSNNPLSYTDPSGYFLKKLGKAAGIGLNFVPGFQGWSTAFIRGFVTGFLVSGGNASAAMLGGIGGAAFGKLGKMEWGAEKVLAHGLVGGALSTAGGGRFGDGFLGAAVAQGFAEKIDDIGLAPDGQISTDPGMQLARVTAAAAVGGTASALGGGKFANGAGMAAFARLYNDEAMHPRRLKTLEEAVNFQLDRSEAAYARLNSEPPLAIGGGYTNQPVGGFIYREHLVKIGPFRLWPTDNFTVGYTVHVDRPHGFVDTWATGRPRHAVALAVYVGPSNIQIPNFSRMSATWQIPVVVRYSNGLVQRYEPAK